MPHPGPVTRASRRALASAAPDGLPVARAGVRWLLQGLFGAAPPFDPGVDAGDPGLCGPGSPSWRLIAEPAAIAGGLRGLLVQVLHPLAMAGVADHSRYREDPLGRLSRTSAYVTTSTFGSVPQALAVARRARGAHRPVRGASPDGRRYAAGSPHLLAWVSVSLTSSLLAADRRWAPTPLTDADADRFVLEQSRISALLDPRIDLDALDSPDGHRRLRAGEVRLPLLDEGELPHDVASLDAVLRRFRGELGVGRQGRDAVRFLRLPPIPPVALPGYASLFAGALGSLAPEERRQLGLPLPAPVAAAGVHQCGVTLTAMRTAVGVSPAIGLATSRIRAAA